MRLSAACCLMVVMLAGCGTTMRAGLDTAADTLGLKAPLADAPGGQAQPPGRLAVNMGRQRAWLVQAGHEQHPSQGALALWYSADGAVLRLHAQGWLLGLNDGARSWRQISPVPGPEGWDGTTAALVDQTSAPSRYVQVLDVQPGDHLGLAVPRRLQPARNAVPAHVQASVPPGLLHGARWFVDQIDGAGARLGSASTHRGDAMPGEQWLLVDLAARPARIVHGHACLAKDWCISWTPPAPADAAPARASAGAQVSLRVQQADAAAGQRLSQALAGTAVSDGPGGAGPYWQGAQWWRAASRAQQQTQRQDLVRALVTLGNDVSDTHARQWARRLAAMPVTGRERLPQWDPHWLAANPKADPVLAAGDKWQVGVRPQGVQVLLQSGSPCALRFQALEPAGRFVRRCEAATPTAPQAAAPWAYLIQPDGRVQRVGLAAWNAQPEPAPAPGSRLWVPAASPAASSWPDDLHAAVAQWLSTQGPFDDAQGLLDLEPQAPSEMAPRQAQPSSPAPLPLPSDWGITGGLQTPTARTRRAGDVGLVVAHTGPYTQYNATLAPFDSLEIALRYTKVAQALYGPAIAADQSYKDKSADVKWRLFDETARLPSLAVGLRDPGGTGLFAGEYLVASKRWGGMDVHLGLGWGYLGARGDLVNPLRLLGQRFAKRTRGDIGQGGTAHLSTLFTGPAAWFGGLQWRVSPGLAGPWAAHDLVLQIEHEGNDYRHEPLGTRVSAGTPWNLGLSGRISGQPGWEGARWRLSWQRGERLAVALSWQDALPQLGVPKRALPTPPMVEPLALLGTGVPPKSGKSTTATAQTDAALLRQVAAHTGWEAVALQRSAQRWVVVLDGASGAHLSERLERLWAVLHEAAPPEVIALEARLHYRQQGMSRHTQARAAWAASRNQLLAKQARAAAPPAQGHVTEVPSPPVAGPGSIRWPGRTQAGFNLGYQQHLGGPDGYLYALVGRGFVQQTLWPGAWVQGSAQVRLLDNYDRFSYQADSALPRVRTGVRDYVRAEGITLPNVQLSQAQSLGSGWYGLAYAGLLEPMFAGAGAELMWRPLHSSVAVSLDVNRVRQRQPSQHLALMPYEVTTGHLTGFWATPWYGVEASLSLGRYLAGDRGATLELARTFGNGTRMGLWATRTNVPAAVFGEGSFDKGVYVSIPFDVLFTSWSGRGMAAAWQPLLRDGGAKLQKGASLWGMTQVREAGAWQLHSPLQLAPPSP